MSALAWIRSPVLRHVQRSFNSTARRSGSNLVSNGPNHGIINMLTRDMEQEEDNPGRNVHKVRAFASAIAAIKRLEDPIRSSEDASKIRGIGTGIARRIAEFFIKADGSERMYPMTLQEVAKANRQNAISVLMTVPGLGRATAAKLVDSGCRTLVELRQPHFRDKLPQSLRVALDFSEQTIPSVTREQAETVAAFIRDHISSRFEVILAGSYRRQVSKSSDIDIILFNPTHVHVPTPSRPPTPRSISRVGRLPTPFYTPYTRVSVLESSSLLTDVVRPLVDRGLIAGTLMSGGQKWQGLARIPQINKTSPQEDRMDRIRGIETKEGVFVRMDLNLAPIKARGAALLALTGNTEFNRMLRTRALKYGMHLNEFGLWRWHRTDRKVDDRALAGGSEEEQQQGYWELVKAERETEIFSALEMEYVEPRDRTSQAKIKHS